MLIAKLESIQYAMQIYVFHNIWRVRFEAIGCREKGYSLQFQRPYDALGHSFVLEGVPEMECKH